MAYVPAFSPAPGLLRPTAGYGRLGRVLTGLVEHRARLLAVIALLAISAGGFLHLIGAPGIGDHVWAAAIVLLAAELMFGSRPPGDSIEM